MSKKSSVDVTNSAIAKRGDYTDVLKKISQESTCPFCEENLTRHHKKPILNRSRYWLVTQNNWPYEGSTHHFLLVLRPHKEQIEDLTKTMWGELQTQIQFLSKKYRFKGGTLLFRSGDMSLTGATVSHLHAHFIVGGPRKPKVKELRAVVGFQK